LEINGDSTSLQASYNGVVRWDAVVVAHGFERLLENRLPLAWKAIMTYWLPDHALMGKQPLLSLRSLLSSFVTMKTWLEGIATGEGGTARGAGKLDLGFANQTFWRCWARWPMIASLASGQYLAALE
jgi:hypothetical protein